jgi:hypothetical protein
MGLQITPGVTDVTATSPIISSGAPTPNITRDATVDYAATAAQSITINDAVTSGPPTALTLSHNTTGTPAIGLGVELDFKGESSTNTDRLMAFIRTHWSDVTDATRTAYLAFSAASLGNDPSADRFYIFGSGGASLYTKQDSGAGIFYVETGYQAGSPTPASGLLLQSDGTKYMASPMTWPTSAPTAGKILRSDGSNIIASTPTYPNAASTAGKVVVSDGTNLIMSTPTLPNASATSRKIIVSDGTNWVASTETYAVPGTAGKVFRSDGTNWTATTPASNYAAVANPTGTSNTTGVMMGLGLAGGDGTHGGITTSAATSGLVMMTISGTIFNATAIADGAKVQLRFGTGTAPINTAALTGTTRGGNVQYIAPTTATKVPFCITALATGLTASTAYWIDVGLAAITGGTATITDLSISAYEL